MGLTGVSPVLLAACHSTVILHYTTYECAVPAGGGRLRGAGGAAAPCTGAAVAAAAAAAAALAAAAAAGGRGSPRSRRSPGADRVRHGGDNPVDPGPKRRVDGDQSWRALPLPLHERQGSPGPIERGHGRSGVQASKAVAHHVRPHTSAYMRAVSPAESCSSCNYATHHRTPHNTPSPLVFSSSLPFPPPLSFHTQSTPSPLVLPSGSLHPSHVHTSLTGPMI